MESKQGTTVLVLFLRNSVPRVAILLTCLRKQTKITSNKTIVGKVRLQCFGRDLNSVPVNRHEIDVVVLEIKRRFGNDTVVSIVIHHTDHQSSRQLPPKQVFFIDTLIPCRHSKTLDFHTLELIFCSAVLQGFDMSKLYGRVGFYLAYKQGHFLQRHFVLCLVCVSTQAKKILESNQTQAFFDSVQQVTILKGQVNMWFSLHIDFFAFGCQSFALCVARVCCSTTIEMSACIAIP